MALRANKTLSPPRIANVESIGRALDQISGILVCALAACEARTGTPDVIVDAICGAAVLAKSVRDQL